MMKKIEGGFLVVNGDISLRAGVMYVLSLIFYFFFEEKIIDVLKDKLGVDRYPNLEVNKDYVIFYYRGKHKRGIIEEKLDYKGGGLCLEMGSTKRI